MTGFFAGIIAALWAGILTSISPCPLATNLAAISFVAKHVEKPSRVYLSGLLYTIGRTLAYVALGALLVSTLLSTPLISHWLQKYMNKLLGPFLIASGLLLLGLYSIRFGGFSGSKRLQDKMERWGIWAGLPLGALFALSLCPTSAALFFGTLLPISVKVESFFWVPFIYGIGTALPVIGFAVFLALGTRAVGSVFNKVSLFEVWARRVTGIVFILVGIYLTLGYVFSINILDFL